MPSGFSARGSGKILVLDIAGVREDREPLWLGGSRLMLKRQQEGGSRQPSGTGGSDSKVLPSTHPDEPTAAAFVLGEL